MISADLSNMGEYMGVVGGILDAMEDVNFKGDFNEHIITNLKKNFMVETIAANINGDGGFNLQHVFEWGGQGSGGVATGTPSSIPLFMLTRSGLRDRQMLTYEFLPSTKPVPLPDPTRYGFAADAVSEMNRHVFHLKALIMETQSSVTITPKNSERLFIPSMESERGYVMTNKSVRVNPGGGKSTGQFAGWWMSWFENRAPEIVKSEANLTEQMLGTTGKRLLRYAAGTTIAGQKVGGRFASSGVSVAFVNSRAAAAKKEVLAASKKYFDNDQIVD